MRTLPALLAALALTLAPPARAEDPQSKLDHLLGLTHGLAQISGVEARKLADEVLADPGTYLPLVVARLDPAEVASEKDPEAARQRANAAGLLAALGKDGVAALLGRLKDLEDQRDQEVAALKDLAAQLPKDPKPDDLKQVDEQNRRISRLSLAEATALASLGTQKLPDARDLLLSRLAQDVDLQPTYVDYFDQTLHGDKAVDSALSDLLKSTPSTNLRHRLQAYFGQPIK